MCEAEAETSEEESGVETNSSESKWHGCNRLCLSIQEWRQEWIYNRQLVLRNTVSAVDSASNLFVIGRADSKGRASDSATWLRAHCINLKVKDYKL